SQEDDSSSASSEWIKVKKRRSGKKGKGVKKQEKNCSVKGDGDFQGLSLDSRVSRSDLKEDKSHVSVGFRLSDQTFRSARPASQQSSRAPTQADAQLCRPAPADLICSVPPSPASQASLLSKAIEGSGKQGTILR
ncbi:hypothetical protein U1Q18_036414, partial [Sarracenia purpurea var. burkii]